jgi:transposase InsO family protein
MTIAALFGLLFLELRKKHLKILSLFILELKIKGLKINKVRSDHEREFENIRFDTFCSKMGYKQKFSVPRTPQQNVVVERKSRTLQELARTMLYEYPLPKHLWAEAVNTACYVITQVNIRPMLKKIPYELWKGYKPNISYF